jgi:amidase
MTVLTRSSVSHSLLYPTHHLTTPYLKGPTTPYATTKHGDFKYVGYTGVYNVVDYSAVSFPSGIAVDKSVDTLPAEYKAHSDFCQAAHDSYDAEAVHGMPVSLQLVAQRLEEEKVLAMTGVVMEAIGRS